MKITSEASNMAQQVKALAAKADRQRSVSESYMEGKTNSHKLSSNLSHVMTCTYPQMYVTHTQRYNVIKIS